jgi:hypothetical protein
MQEMPHETFVSFMKVVAAICIIAMVLSVWPGDTEE